MPNTEKKKTTLDFLLDATTYPLGPKLYKVATKLGEKEGIERVKQLMAEHGVYPTQIKKNARLVYETVRDFIKTAKVPEPGAGVKY